MPKRVRPSEHNGPLYCSDISSMIDQGFDPEDGPCGAVLQVLADKKGYHCPMCRSNYSFDYGEDIGFWDSPWIDEKQNRKEAK